jgi:hypothetical protein
MRIVVAVGATAAVCFAISAGMSFGARSSKVITVSPGESFALSEIGWSCEYGGGGKPPRMSLTCNPGPLDTTTVTGDPTVSIQHARVVLFGGSRPKLNSLATPKCCLRIWSFPATTKTPSGNQPSDIDLVAGNSISVPSLDLLCRVLASDPDHHDPGNVFYCLRQSVAGKKPTSATMEASRFHMRVAEPGATQWAATVSRSP